MNLISMECTPKDRIIAPLKRGDAFELLNDLQAWSLEDGHLVRRFERQNISECLSFAGEVIRYSEKCGHIPDVSIRKGREITISWYSYQCGGLTINDFIMAAKLDMREFAIRGTSA